MRLQSQAGLDPARRELGEHFSRTAGVDRSGLVSGDVRTVRHSGIRTRPDCPDPGIRSFVVDIGRGGIFPPETPEGTEHGAVGPRVSATPPAHGPLGTSGCPSKSPIQEDREPNAQQDGRKQESHVLPATHFAPGSHQMPEGSGH
jgi:hypothetical protein